MTKQQSIQDLTELLANLSVADTCHDFGDVITKSRFNNASNGFKDAYKAGLYNSKISITALDEEESLESVVFNPRNYKHSTFKNTTPGSENNITTVNGKEYTVRYCPAKNGGEYIDARTFVDTLDITTYSAFVIDAVALSINHIFERKQNDKMDNFSVYYLMSSEIVNDPAGKTPLCSPELKDSVYIPCEPYQDENKVYIYSCNDQNGYNRENPIPEKSFFTKYQFQLSGLKYNKSTSKWDTNLLITNNEDDKIFYDSTLDPCFTDTKEKKKGKLNAISSLLDVVASFFTASSTSTEKKKIFNFNRSIQQKRSGDWLQVLFCLAVPSRTFANYRNKEKIQNMEDIYFVTHDRIAMAFALLMGVNVLFSNGHDHAFYTYKLNNPAESIAKRIKRVQEINTNDIEIKKTGIVQKMNTYNLFFNSISSNPLAKINESMNNLNELDINKNTNPKTNIIPNIINLFKSAFFYCHCRNLFPTIDENYLIDFETYFKKLVGSVESARKRNYKEDELHKEIINKYNYFNSCYTTCNELYNRYYTKNGVIIQIDKIVKDVQKVKHYKLIESWNLTTSVSSRVWKFFYKNTQYKSDKNIFLVDLKEIPEEYKIRIYQTFKSIYDKIQNVEKEVLEKTSWMNVLCGFCLEVFIYFPPPVQPDVNIAMNNQMVFNDLREDVIIRTKIELDESNTTFSMVDSDDTTTTATISGGSGRTARKQNPKKINMYSNYLHKSIKKWNNKIWRGGYDHSTVLIDQEYNKVIYHLLTMDITRDNILLNHLTGDRDLVHRLLENPELLDSEFYKIMEKLTENIVVNGPGLGTVVGGRYPTQTVPKILSMDNNTGSRSRSRSSSRTRSKSKDKNKKNVHDSPKNQQQIHFLHTNYQSFCFHPLVPIYLILLGFSVFIADNIEDSLDYPIYIYYYEVLNRLVFNLINLCKKNVLKAYIVGLGIKELFFNMDIINSTEEFKYFFHFSPILETHVSMISDFSLFSALSNQLSYYISGKIPYSSSEMENAIRILQSPLMSSFLQETMPIQHVNAKMDIQTLNKNVYELTMVVAKRIVMDRNTELTSSTHRNRTTRRKTF